MAHYINDLAETLDLNGLWELSLGDQTRLVHVPGCWEAQDFDRYIEGPAVYRRTFALPQAWAGQRVRVQFDAVSHHAEVALNGQAIGVHDGLWTPFEVPLPEGLPVGETHELTVTVYKPGETYPMRESLAGFLPDVCTTFGGIWQPVRLVAAGAAGFTDIRLQPAAESGMLALQASITGLDGAGAVRLDILDTSGSAVASVSQPVQGVDGTAAVKFALAVPGHQRWRPADPALYTARLCLEQAGQLVARAGRSFGFRTLASSNDQLLFNGEPVCLRGLLHWGWYPDQICPAPDAETIRDEFRRAREMGFNLIKLCLWVPPPLYFEIADEKGMFLWLELPMWLPEVTPVLRAHAPAAYEAILARVHHHPSVVVYSLGCELNRTVDADLLARLDGIARRHALGALLCDNSGSGEAYGGLSTDFADFSDYHFYCDLQFFDPLIDHFRRDWQPPRPWIFGEFSDSDDFRDPVEIATAHGGQMPWWWLHENPIHGELRRVRRHQAERAAATGWSMQALQRTSRQTSLVMRKTILEKVRRRRGMGGYVITSFRDTPVATSAPFDDLGRAKWDPEDVRRFNADSVLVLDQGRARAWQRGGDRPRRRDLFNYAAGEWVSLRLILAHSGPALPAGSVRWWVTDPAGRTLADQTIDLRKQPEGGLPREVAAIGFQAPAEGSAAALMLRARLEAGPTVVANQWPLWIYPAVQEWPARMGLFDPSGCLAGLDDLRDAVGAVDAADVLLASAAPPDLADTLRAGGRVLLLQPEQGSLAAQPCPFWRESIKLLEDHPLMHAMPHAGFADLQFYSLAADHALDAHALWQIAPDIDIRPVLSRLDARLFTYAHYLVDGRLGQGRIVASTLRFAGGLGDQPCGLCDNPAGRYWLRVILDDLRKHVRYI